MRALRGQVAAALAVVVTMAACSNGADQNSTPRDPAEATTPPGPAAADPPATKRTAPKQPAVSAPVPSTAAPTTAPAPEPFVSVGVEIGPTSTVVEAPAIPADDPLDPFGSFAACSGLRESVDNWSLQVSDPTQDVTAVSILTGSPVTGPGTFEGSYRIEFVNGAALGGTGIVTLEEGLQSGSFEAQDADVRGTFECTGVEAPELTPVEPGVEVMALVRNGAAERMISLSEPYEPGVASCDPAGPVQVRGEAGIGAPVEIVIAQGAVALRIGGADVAMNPGHTRVQVDGPTGSFHAVTADGLEIDGAFSCT